MRLIDADALIALIKKRLKNTAIIGWLCRIISEVPTSEAEPVRHGRWECEFETYGKLRCSACKNEALLETANDALYATSNYCPNCGAKMDGDSHD